MLLVNKKYKNLRPSRTNSTHVIRKDMFFMHHIKHNIKIYLADFILQDMMEVTTKKNRTLVYGMVYKQSNGGWYQSHVTSAQVLEPRETEPENENEDTEVLVTSTIINSQIAEMKDYFGSIIRRLIKERE
ncbi:Uncharacterized protein TCM_012725 [Theobroma cacao]|uniref:Uncharacterized protein n=1 Tax=Theobroma cacao TaxID=3641 RepID=A0A061FWP0_THECC|nr:Uncharacterized protein TCM_012725 [Theobroma cacao]